MKTNILILTMSLSAFIFQGCEKEDNFMNPSNQPYIEASSPTDLEADNDLLKQIRSDSKITNVKLKSGVIDPINTNNNMDYIGAYFHNMILSVSSSESTYPSTTENEYTNKYHDYMAQNDIGFDFDSLSFSSTTLFFDLAQEAIDYALLDTALIAVNSLIAFENNVATTTLLTNDQKTQLLAFSAAMKYSRSTIANDGLIIGTDTISGGNLLKFSAKCFDREFSKGAHAGFKVLVDKENLVLAAVAWAGLPATIIGSIGNGFYQGIKNCI